MTIEMKVASGEIAEPRSPNNEAETRTFPPFEKREK
jgi:hypothetical protein